MDPQVIEGPLEYAFEVKDPNLGCVLKVSWKLPDGVVWEEFRDWFDAARLAVEVGGVTFPVRAQSAGVSFSDEEILTAALGTGVRAEQFVVGTSVRFLVRE